MRSITRILLVSFLLTSSLLAQLPSQFTRLEAEYRRTRAQTIQQLNARYIASLEALKRTQMTQNDLTGANAAQALIDELKTENAALTKTQSAQPALATPETPLTQTIATTPKEVYLDHGQHRGKEATFKVEQRPRSKARLVLKFRGKEGGTGSTAGNILLARAGSPPKKIDNWTSKEAKKGEFTCDVFKHIAEPGEYIVRLVTTERGGEFIRPEIQTD